MNILVDISNIIPGVGGSGGGIAVYAGNLLAELDMLELNSDITIFCIVNKKNNTKTYKNIRVIETTFNTKSFIARFLWLNFYLPVFCIKNKIAVLHRVVPELPLIKVCNYICTLHDLMYRFHLQNASHKQIKFKHKLKAVGYGLLLKRSLSNANQVLVPSYAIKNEVVEVLNVVPEKIEVTHEGVKKIASQRLNNNSSNQFKILVVAGFYPHKGHAKVLELVKALIRKGVSNFTITLQGNPFYLNILEDIKAEIKKHDLEAIVLIENFKKEHNIEQMYATYDCFLLLSEYEGFGLPVLEAQMSGLPVVCSEISVFKEVLSDSAIFVDTNDIDGSCTEVIQLMQDAALRKTFIEKGFENCKRFSWNKMAKETLVAYTSC